MIDNNCYRSIAPKQSYLLAGLLLFSSSSSALEDYVPPPTGPYQSSIIINMVPLPGSREEIARQSRIYKFPTADMYDQLNQTSQSENRLDNPPPQVFRPDEGQNRAKAIAPQPLESIPNFQPEFYTQPSPGYSQYPAPQYMNPWPGNQAWQSGGYQNSWGNYNYPGTYTSPYPYGYSDQYYGTNSPYTGIPSPRGIMPTNPFSSGK